MKTTAIEPDYFFASLRGVRRLLSVSSVLFVLAMIALVGIWMQLDMVALAAVLFVAAIGATIVAYRFGQTSDSSYFSSTHSVGYCEGSSDPTSCGLASCAGGGGSCQDRFEREMKLRIMEFEQDKLRSYVGPSYLSQLGMVALWPVVTAGALVSGAIPRPAGAVVLMVELVSFAGFSAVRSKVRSLAPVSELSMAEPSLPATSNTTPEAGLQSA